jgi:hypothetical protein
MTFVISNSADLNTFQTVIVTPAIVRHAVSQIT